MDAGTAVPESRFELGPNDVPPTAPSTILRCSPSSDSGRRCTILCAQSCARKLIENRGDSLPSEETRLGVLLEAPGAPVARLRGSLRELRFLRVESQQPWRSSEMTKRDHGM